MALFTWVAVVIALAIAYVSTLSVYRLLLSPLARIPGPKLAGLTSWYEIVYDIVQPGQYVWRIKEMHQIYGPIVRVAPNEVHVSDVNFLDEIYAGASRNREKYEFQLRSLPVPMSMGTTRTHDLHRRRREALNPFFSKRSVISLEPMIKTKVSQLKQVFEKHRKNGTMINLSDVYFAFANE